MGGSSKYRAADADGKEQREGGVMVTDAEIIDAKAVLVAALKAYQCARDALEKLEITQACEQYKIGIGMFVTDRRGRKGIVSRVKPWNGSRPWVTAKQIKKDGST